MKVEPLVFCFQIIPGAIKEIGTICIPSGGSSVALILKAAVPWPTETVQHPRKGCE